MVDNLSGFLNAISNNGQKQRIPAFGASQKNGTPQKSNTPVSIRFPNFNDDLFCPKCGAVRRCQLEHLTFTNYSSSYINPELSECFRLIDEDVPDSVKFDSLPAIYESTCLQCTSKTLLIVYQGPTSLELAVLHDTYGGYVTANTPEEVKYYIDQAYRARSVGALSAAMSMYRSALEWVLFQQGFTKGMLGQKISDLENAIKDDNVPKWAKEIDSAFLKAIKDIGNGAIHTNGGDIKQQSEIDKDLIEVVDVVFSELLDKIYEQPVRSSNNLSKLQSVFNKTNKS